MEQQQGLSILLHRIGLVWRNWSKTLVLYALRLRWGGTRTTHSDSATLYRPTREKLQLRIRTEVIHLNPHKLFGNILSGFPPDLPPRPDGTTSIISSGFRSVKSFLPNATTATRHLYSHIFVGAMRRASRHTSAITSSESACWEQPATSRLHSGRSRRSVRNLQQRQETNIPIRPVKSNGINSNQVVVFYSTPLLH